MSSTQGYLQGCFCVEEWVISVSPEYQFDLGGHMVSVGIVVQLNGSAGNNDGVFTENQTLVHVGQAKLRTPLNNGNSAPTQETTNQQESSPHGHGAKSQVRRPMQPDAWWKDTDDFLTTDAWGPDSRGSHPLGPTIWLKHTEEQMRLCIYQCRAVTLVLLVPTQSSVSGLDGLSLLRGQILEKVGTLMKFH